MLLRCDVCLVETANPENLGAVARLLDNFGLPSLTLVAPRVAPDDPRAAVVARAARSRLLGARIHATLGDAVREASCVVGFSARRGGGRPMIGLRALAGALDAQAPTGSIALVFGPEDSGLTTAHIDACDLVVAIETRGALPSLNLAQAVALALWELARPVDGPPATPPRGGATRAELEGLVDHALAALEAAGVTGDGDREARRVHWRRVLAAAALRPDDVRALRGLCAQLLRASAPMR